MCLITSKLPCNTNGPFYQHGLALIKTWISNYIHGKVWCGISYSFPKFNGAGNGVWEWKRNFIPHFFLFRKIYIHATTKDMLYTKYTYHTRSNYFTVTIIAQTYCKICTIQYLAGPNMSCSICNIFQIFFTSSTLHFLILLFGNTCNSLVI